MPHVHYLRIVRRQPRDHRARGNGASVPSWSARASSASRSRRRCARAGIEVHVVAPEALPLERVMGAELGGFIRTLHEEHGVMFHLGQTRRGDRRAQRDAQERRARSSRSRRHRRRRAAGDRAGRAGRAWRSTAASSSNEYLETSAPGVFAAGDIARWPDPHTGERIRVEHWVVAERQGQTAARNMLGRRERFDAVPFFWSEHYDVDDQLRRSRRAVGRHRDRRRPRRSATARSAYRRGGRTLAIATIGRDRREPRGRARTGGSASAEPGPGSDYGRTSP